MKQVLYVILIVIFAAIFLVSAYFIGDYLIESLSSQSQYNDLANRVEQGKNQQSTVPFTRPDATEGTDSTDPQPPTILPEYAELYLQNPDMVGWIKIEDTRINYPVMQTPNAREFYLQRDFNKEKNAHGCLFVREECDVWTPSDNVTIYGHNMKDGTMFHDLAKFLEKSFWSTHRTFTYDTLLEHHTYEIMAVFTTTASVGKGFSYHLFDNAADQAEFDEFVATCKELSLYDTGVTAAYGDKLICLSTCEYTHTNGRLVVVAKRIS